MKQAKLAICASTLILTLVVILGLTVGVKAQAGELLYAYRATATENRIVSFNSTSPGTILSNVLVTGLQTNEFIVGIDSRPATGQLYAIGSTSRVYVINPTTGVATSVGSTPFTPAISTSPYYGFDFNPSVDLIRLVNTNDLNLRINPNTGATVSQDPNLNRQAGDPNASLNLIVNHVAYSNNRAGASTTTLYGIDWNTDTLVTINPANNGTAQTVGSLGIVTSSNTQEGGFDISGATGIAYAALTASDETRNLYTINLTTGAATLIGPIGAGDVFTDGLTVAAPATASGVTISGRVFAPKQRSYQSGKGLPRAVVTISDVNGVSRSAKTDSNGYFRFEEVEAGQTYIFNVYSKQYQFDSKVITINENLIELNFTPQRQ